jgi:putative CocE/NonD family hydrolase
MTTTPASGDLQTDGTETPATCSRREAITGLTATGVTLALAPAIAGAESPLRAGPRKVKSIENVWIPMKDGVRIAARIWLPEDAEQRPVPAIIEYIPYRKRDSTRLSNEAQHPYYASFGYACIRPDIRGSGDSDGLPMDEYEQPEQDDAVEIIAWAARQRWCTGKVGMFGISWGGFSSLQVAARRPPALKAIITHCSTDDRYTDDAHYTGGLINECMFYGWGVAHTANGPRPPDPAIVGDRWRDMWMKRLAALDFYVGNWLSHQRRDAFWKHASIDEDYSAITCAVYAQGGWTDPYRCTVARMLANLKCPRKGLVGPWGHQYPHQANLPGPAIDWLTEALRWWDHWLKGIDTGVMKEPMYRVWMQSKPAMLKMRDIPGRWVAEEQWPTRRIEARTMYLTGGGLSASAGPEQRLTLRPQQTVGITAPRWYTPDLDTEMPTDQSMDDARSLSFDSMVLAEDFEILGAAVLNLELSVDKPIAFIAVRLNEVQSNGESWRVTYGVLNLTHRDSHENPQALEPGKRYKMRVPLQDTAYTFKAGTRLRVAISTTYWPAFWPSPEPVTLTAFAGRSSLELPVRPTRAEDAHLHPFGEAFVPETSGMTVLKEGAPSSKVFEWNVGTRKLVVRSESRDQGIQRLNATGTEMSGTLTEVSEINDDDPTSAKTVVDRTQGYKRGDWDVMIRSRLEFSVTKDDFLLVGRINVLEGNKEVFARTWDRKIKRDFM